MLINLYKMENILQAGMIGTPQIILIVVALLLLFGGKKLPELMKGMGKGNQRLQRRDVLVMIKLILMTNQKLKIN